MKFENKKSRSFISTALFVNNKPPDSLGEEERLTVEKNPPFVYNKSCDLPVATIKQTEDL